MVQKTQANEGTEAKRGPGRPRTRQDSGTKPRAVAVVRGAEGAETERSEGAAPGAEGTTATAATSLEVTLPRRRFSTSFKLRIVREAEALGETPGGVGALLRREGIYSSHLAEWRKAAKAGLLVAGKQPKVGRPSKDGLSPTERRYERENARLRERLRQAELIIDVQKKVGALLGQLQQSEQPD